MKDFRQHALNLIKTFLAAYTALIFLFFLFFTFSRILPTSEALFLAVDVATLTGFAHSILSAGYELPHSWILLLLINTSAMAFLYFVCRFYQLIEACQISQNTFRFKAFSSRLIREIGIFLLVFQGAVFIMIFYAVSGNVTFQSLPEKIYFSLSYTIGALTHFRIDLLGGGQWEHLPEKLLIFKLVVTLGTIIGGLGYFITKDLFYPPNLRHRLEYPETNWKRYTQVALIGTFLATIISGIFIYVLEHNSTFSSYKLTESLFSGFIWAINAQFGGLDNALLFRLSPYTLVILIILMVIGGATGTTAGGIKFSLLYLTTKRHFLWKGIAMYLMFVVLMNIVLTYILSASSGTSLPEAAFLQASAFFNVGWGLELLEIAQPIPYGLLTVSMIVGRLSTVLWPWFLVIKWKPAKLPEEMII